MKSSKPTDLKKGRPKLPKASENMKAWSAALSTEVGSWPQVSGRAFFGLTAFHRRDRIFALLPRTRAMETPNSLGFKLESSQVKIVTRLERDSRVGSTQMRKARWFTFELRTADDLRAALRWLEAAYQAARKTRQRS